MLPALLRGSEHCSDQGLKCKSRYRVRAPGNNKSPPPACCSKVSSGDGRVTGQRIRMSRAVQLLWYTTNFFFQLHARDRRSRGMVFSSNPMLKAKAIDLTFRGPETRSRAVMLAALLLARCNCPVDGGRGKCSTKATCMSSWGDDQLTGLARPSAIRFVIELSSEAELVSNSQWHTLIASASVKLESWRS